MYLIFGTSQPSSSDACQKPTSKTHLQLPVYASNLRHNHSEVVACRPGGHAASRRLTKQSGTWFGRARWVSDKLYCVTWSVALHSLPVKYSWLLFRHCPPSPLKMDLEHVLEPRCDFLPANSRQGITQAQLFLRVSPNAWDESFDSSVFEEVINTCSFTEISVIKEGQISWFKWSGLSHNTVASLLCQSIL